MENLHNGFTLHIPSGCFPLSTDSMLLSDFVKLPKRARVLDLGGGCGTLGILLCAKDPHCHVTCIEIDGSAHAAASDNILRNGLTDRMESICADLRSFSNGPYDVCLSNPPYFTGGLASRTAPFARRDDNCTAEELFFCAARCLKFGGDFYLVHKPENLARLCTLACQSGLEPKKLRLIHHKEGSAITLILLACRKGAKPGLIIDEVTLFDKQNQPTDFYKNLYHIS